MKTLSTRLVLAIAEFPAVRQRSRPKPSLPPGWLNVSALRVALDSTFIVLYKQHTDLHYTWIHKPGFKTEPVRGRG